MVLDSTSPPNPAPELVLASTSRYRRELLERLGVPFECAAPPVDEEAWKVDGADPVRLAEQLAEAKAASLVERHPGAAIVGCDQIAVCDGRRLSKPGTFDRALDQLLGMSGREHELITAMCVCHGGRTYRHTDRTTLRMRRLDAAALKRYLHADRPFDCAGSYKLECRGIGLFESIDGRDPSAITGLPLMALAGILSRLGFAIP